jgi:hypothetical protein
MRGRRRREEGGGVGGRGGGGRTLFKTTYYCLKCKTTHPDLTFHPTSTTITFQLPTSRYSKVSLKRTDIVTSKENDEIFNHDQQTRQAPL